MPAVFVGFEKSVIGWPVAVSMTPVGRRPLEPAAHAVERLLDVGFDRHRVVDAGRERRQREVRLAPAGLAPVLRVSAFGSFGAGAGAGLQAATLPRAPAVRRSAIPDRVRVIGHTGIATLRPPIKSIL